MKSLILAGGQSKNLYPFAETGIKGLLPFGNTNILSHLVQQLNNTGINEIYIVINKEKSSLFEKELSLHNKANLHIQYILQDSYHSIGETLLLCKNYIGQDSHFLLIYGDIFLAKNPFISFLSAFKQSQQQALAAITHSSIPGMYDTAHLTTNMRIASIEYNDNHLTSNYILSGFFILPKSYFTLLKESNNDMQQALSLLAQKEQLHSFLWNNDWIDISYSWHFLLTNQMYLDEWNSSIIPSSATIESNVKIKGAVRLGENVTICSGTTIIGPCYVGDNTFISNNCLIRSYSSIGNNVTIAYGTEIKNSILCQNVKIGRLSFIGDSIIGENTVTGSSIITINYAENIKTLAFYNEDKQLVQTNLSKLGSFIGNNSFIGSGHNLAPGFTAKSNSHIPNLTTLQYFP